MRNKCGAYEPDSDSMGKNGEQGKCVKHAPARETPKWPTVHCLMYCSEWLPDQSPVIEEGNQ